MTTARPDRMPRRRFRFEDARWFRLPLRAVVITLFTFALLNLYPALTRGTPNDHERAVFGLTVLMAFTVLATVAAVAINDSYVEIEEETLFIRFEAFFNVRVPLADVLHVSFIDPKPAWRYRFGLSADRGRVACSHGGRMVQIELARPCGVKIWPRTHSVRRFWLGLTDPEAFLAELQSSRSQGKARLSAAA